MSSSTTRPRDRRHHAELSLRHDARFVGLTANVGSGRSTQRRAGGEQDTGGRPSSTRTACLQRAGWNGCWPTSRIPSWPPWRRASCRRRADESALVARYEAVRSSLNPGPGPASYGPGRTYPSYPAPSSWSEPSLSTGHRLFDPELRGGEDVDLEWRLVAAGWDVRYEPRAWWHTIGAATVGSLPRSSLRLRHLGRAPGPPAWRRHGTVARRRVGRSPSGSSACCDARDRPWRRRPHPS